jgi:hypothetical protein
MQFITTSQDQSGDYPTWKGLIQLFIYCYSFGLILNSLFLDYLFIDTFMYLRPGINIVIPGIKIPVWIHNSLKRFIFPCICSNFMAQVEISPHMVFFNPICLFFLLVVIMKTWKGMERSCRNANIMIVVFTSDPHHHREASDSKMEEQGEESRKSLGVDFYLKCTPDKRIALSCFEETSSGLTRQVYPF